MKSIWKGLISLFISLLGLALWLAGSIFEGIAEEFGESFLLTRGAMGIGFLLIFLGPIFFWIILPLKDRWYEPHPKRFIIAIIPFVLFLLLIFGVVISGIIHEPQIPTYSFNTTIEGDKIVVDINRIHACSVK
jgi:formate-dependent nitrite reductase membrane component NrfD